VYETVAGTAGIAPPGGYLAATAKRVGDYDVFFVSTAGELWRVYTSQPTVPHPVATRLSPAGSAVGAPGGPIAAVSRQASQVIGSDANSGDLDVVFAQSAAAVGLGKGPAWYSLSNEQWTSGSLPSAGAPAAISIVAPSGSELRTFVKNSKGNLFTSDLVVSGVPTWTSWFGIETLTP
jgi:hypothetical protein